MSITCESGYVDYHGKRISTIEYERIQNIAEMKTPLFDFGKSGTPRRRRAFYRELPLKFKMELSRIKTNFMRDFEKLGEQLSEVELREKMVPLVISRDKQVSPFWLPEWYDYTPQEQRALVKDWGVTVEINEPSVEAEEDVPF